MEKDKSSSNEFSSIFLEPLKQELIFNELDSMSLNAINQGVLFNKRLPEFDPAGFILRYGLTNKNETDKHYQELGVYFARKIYVESLDEDQEIPCLNVFDLNLVNQAKSFMGYDLEPTEQFNDFLEELFGKVLDRLFSNLGRDFESKNVVSFKDGFMRYLGLVQIL